MPFLFRDRLRDGVGGDGGFVELRAEFWGALLGFEVDVDDAEALAVAVGPLVVVEEAPAEIALDGDAFGDGAVELGEIVAQEHGAVGVEDGAVGGELVVGRGAVFGDEDGLRMPDVVNKFG